MLPSEVARLIDHTLLRPDAKYAEIVRLCEEAKTHLFASVCVNPFWVAAAHAALAGTPVKVCTVVGFPLGANLTATKTDETRLALAEGAQEIDMVMNIGALKSGVEQVVESDIRAVAAAAHHGGAILKVILETALLTDPEKELACRIAVAAGADFVKTSTGFAKGGATPEDVALLRRSVGPALGVKASGGIRTLEDAFRMIASGASRLGASSSVALVSAGGDPSGAY